MEVLWEGQAYRVRVYYDPQRRARGAYHAVTVLGPGDWLVSDGASPDEVVRKQQEVLPLAILSRAIGKEA
jgi:hypothetical protein